MKSIHAYIVFLCIIYSAVKAQDNHIKYSINENGYSFSINPLWDNTRKALRMDHRSNIDSVIYTEYFNRGIRRGNNIVVTGDRPRFALLKHLVQDQLSPDMIKMGDGMISINIGGRKELLHLQKNISVIFDPGSTQYTCSLDSFPGLKITLLVSQARDWGAVVRLAFENTGSRELDLTASLIFGGTRICGRTFTPAYFLTDEKEDLRSNAVEKVKDAIEISAENIPGKIAIYQLPAGTTSVENHKARLSKQIILNAAATKTIYYVVKQSLEKRGSTKKIDFAAVENLIEESRGYYRNILKCCMISTPDKILDAGFRTAVLNFDNIYEAPAWLEGIHWWSAYWANNYQISAAISLGEILKAKKAILFFNSKKYGPSPAMMLSGNPFADSLRQGWEDGLPYYLFQLIQYYRSTGDGQLMKAIWPALSNSIHKLWLLRDPDKNGLLNWHMGANAFLYQADHLGMPGDAASPSLFMAGMLREMAVIAAEMGYSDSASEWRSLSDTMYLNLEKILWNSPTGTYYSHKDLQQIIHRPHYYSDFVFPALYANFNSVKSWQCLQALYNTLWVENYTGDKSLIRVGDLKPSLFGNDNVMPVQMAEAARAYFKLGEFGKGIKLLSSVALAGTIFTEAPGNFPERMNNEGKGELNYLFGNPIASFIEATISGLFGVELTDKSNAVKWNPSFPETWNEASLRLPHVRINFKKKSGNGITAVSYKMAHNKERQLEFSLLLSPGHIRSVSCNGKQMKYELRAGIGKMEILLSAGKAMSHEVRIVYEAKEVKVERMVYNNDKFLCELNTAIDSLYDPQNVFERSALSNTIIDGTINGNCIGHHSFFVKVKGLPVVYPISVDLHPVKKITEEKVDISGIGTNSTVIDISPYRNTDTVYAFTEWRNSNLVFDEAYYVSIDSNTKRVFAEYGLTGPILKMAMINNGISHQYTRETVKTRFEPTLTVPVNKKGDFLSLLFINEMETRLTGATVGRIILIYTDGSSRTIL